MKNKWPVVHSFGHAVCAFAYIAGVAWVVFNGEALFGKGHMFMGPVLVLTLFVLSATIVGTLILGRPILLYVEGARSAALRFFMYTVGWLFVILIVSFVCARGW